MSTRIPLKQVVGLAFGTPALLAAFDATNVADFAKVGCGSVNDEYQLIVSPSAALLAAVDGVNVIAASAPAGAVWCRLFTRNLPAQYETAWFLDAAAGDDRNAGTTVGAPLRTMRELSARLKGARIAASVVVTLAAGNYGADPVQFDIEVAQSVTISIVGNVTSSPDTVAAVLPTVAGAAATNVGAQRGTLTATAFDFQAANDRQRLRITAGTAANIGGMAFVTRVVTPGVGGVVNTTRWGRLTNPLTSTVVTNLTIVAGDTYAVDTLNSQIGAIDIRVRGNGKFVIQDCLIRPTTTLGVTQRGVCDNANINGVLTYGCIFQAASSLIFQDGQWTHAICQFSSDVGNIVYAGIGFMVERMCVWTGTAATPVFTITLQSATTMQQSEGACVDGGRVLLQNGAVWDQIGQTNNDVQFVDGTGVRAVEVAQGGRWWSHSGTNFVWGLDNAYSSTTVVIQALGQWNYNNIPSVPGGTGGDFNVGGVIGAWAALPVIVTTAAAGTAASAGAGAAMVSG